MRKREYYFVDLENVHNDWSMFLSEMGRHTTLLLFYSHSAPNINISSLIEAKKKGVKLKFIQCENGAPNALDFQLSSEFGSRIRFAGKSAAFYIVADDHGYDAIIGMWTERGKNAMRLSPGTTLRASQPADSEPEPDKPVKTWPKTPVASPWPGGKLAAASAPAEPEPAQTPPPPPVPKTPAYVSPLPDSVRRHWTQQTKAAVNKFNHIPPPVRGNIIKVMYSLPDIAPAGRSADNVQKMLDEHSVSSSFYTNPRVWGSLAQSIHYLERLERTSRKKS